MQFLRLKIFFFIKDVISLENIAANSSAEEADLSKMAPNVPYILMHLQCLFIAFKKLIMYYFRQYALSVKMYCCFKIGF